MNVKKFSWAMVTALIWATQLSGDESVLTLTASGVIVRPPHWEDASNKPLTNLNFDFSRVADSGQPGRDVDSQIARAKLVDALRYPAAIELTRPKNCSIGQVRVDDQHVHFIHNRRLYTNDMTFQIFSSFLNIYGLRFSKKGQYGDKFGAVSCQTPGALTYVY
jgi:hypothetical protein